MLKIVASKQFRKDLKLAMRRGLDISSLQNVVDAISRRQVLDSKYNDHELSGYFKGYRECHVEPDWLLIYRVDDKVLKLFLLRTGTHSDLFK